MAAGVMMAKAPVPGQVKTRLCPPLTFEQAAALAEAFALDTWTALAQVVTPQLAYVGDLEMFSPMLGHGAVPQVEGDLGARIVGALEAGLARDRVALVIGSDLPGLPPAHLRHVVAAVVCDDTVCLGPSADGGFYAIVARRTCHQMLAEIEWSATTTLNETCTRLKHRGFRPVLGPTFDDIDTFADLNTLREQLSLDPTLAPTTARALKRGRSLAV